MGKRICFSLLICLLAFTWTAFGQETTGAIQGTVKDPQGAVVPGATVEVTSPALLGKKTATTDSAGAYHIEQLPPGLYSVSVNAAGFAPQTQSNLPVNVGVLRNIDVTLKVGGVTTEVSVSAEAAAIDVTQSKVATIVSEDMVVGLPKSRSFQSLIPLAPGARQEPLQSARGDRNSGFQIDGAADSENVYLIDGINTTNIQSGGVGKNFQSDFVQEVQIKSSSFEAEFGGALGGVINAVGKRGSNTWHGEVKTHYQTAALDANDPCASGFTYFSGGSLVCGQRLNPLLPGLNTTTRLDGTPEYYVAKKDSRHVIEPGYELGGPLFKDKLTFFSSLVPMFDTTQRTTTFTGLNPGPRRLSQTVNQYNTYNRVDYTMSNQLRFAGAWNYAYSRTQGTLGQPDSAFGQVNSGATVDPNTLRADSATVRPLHWYSFSGDWTPTSKLVVSSRYGYFFNNAETRGTPVGIRYIYDTDLNASTKDVNGNAIAGGSFAHPTGFFNIPNNFTTNYDAYRRKSWNSDASYFVGNLGGSHNFKGGYMWGTQYNIANVSANTAVVNIDWGIAYNSATSATTCATIINSNSNKLCQGQYGYFFVGSTTTSQSGFANAVDQAFYFQDSWTVGTTGLTLNPGVRFDHEVNPAYDPKRFPDITFGWGSKIAPRIGGAYDALHNGKLKIYADYGKYFDIMKLGLTRGSFGSDYWHECFYALDTLDYNTITPTLTTGAGCPATGPAPGVAGRFIENVDLRATKADPRDPAIQANMKPVQSHSMDIGADWSINNSWMLETRYTRKRLDQTIEDMAITDNLGFYIGNPGSAFADILHRPTVIPCDPKNGFACTPDADGNYFNQTSFCAECPGAVKPSRRYDGIEFRLTRKPGAQRLFGTISYTYSKLRGNYSGLTDTDPTDGNGGRHSPNNGRAFDIPTMSYLPSGKIDDGPLSTDRPHTAKVYGYYRLPWMGHETMLGVFQSFYQGTPISTCLGVLGVNNPDSACQWAEGRGNFVKLHRDSATGNIVSDGVVKDARTPVYLQTDLNIRQAFSVSKDHENYKIVIEATGTNLLNQHAATSYYEYAVPSNHIAPQRPARFAGDLNVDFARLENGYNYIDAFNATGAFAGAAVGQPKLTLANRYGLPWTFQTARQFRFELRFVF